MNRNSSSEASPPAIAAAAAAAAAAPIAGKKGLKLFGVVLSGRGDDEEDVMRKCASMGNLASFATGGAAAEGGGAGDQGYLSDVGPLRRRRGGGPERKRGVPWTEEEHRTFLVGLKMLGKGDWRGISREFVPSRTPTQVASHAQKYFLRQSNPNKKKRRCSLFDVVIDETVPDAETEVSLKNAYEATKRTDHPCQDNNLTHIPSFNRIPSVSQHLSAMINYTEMPASRRVNFMAGTSYPMDQTLPSLVPTYIMPKQATPMFQSNSPSFVPDFLNLSLSHPHRPTQSFDVPPSIDNSDLELRIAPPQPHSLAKLSSRGGTGAIRVV